MDIARFLNAWIYPSLLKYQGGNNMGRFLKEHNIPAKNTFIYQDHIWHSLHFYNKNIVTHKDSLQHVSTGDFLIVKSEKVNDFVTAGKKFDIVYRLPTYGVSRLKIKFLIPSRRKELTEDLVLIKIK